MSNVIIRRFFPSTDTGSPGTTDLVAWWEMDESSAPAVDSHGANDLSSWVGSISSVTGLIGNSLQSNNSFSGLEGAPGIDFRNKDFSVAGWWYVPGYNDAFPGRLSLLSKRGAFNGRQIQILVAGTNNVSGITRGNLYAAIWENDSSAAWPVYDSGITINTSARSFIVVTFNNTSKEVGFSVNGSALNQISVGHSITHGGAPANPFSLLKDSWANTNSINGITIDQTGIFYKALSQSECDWLYNSGAGRQYSDL